MLAGSDAYAFAWSPCVPSAVGRVLDGLSGEARLFDDPIISHALAKCGYELRVVECGDEPINREDLFGDINPYGGRSSEVRDRSAKNIALYATLFPRRQRRGDPPRGASDPRPATRG